MGFSVQKWYRSHFRTYRNHLYTSSKERLEHMKITILHIKWTEIALELPQIDILCTICLFLTVKPYFSKKYVYGYFRAKNMNLPLKKSLSHHKIVFLAQYSF